MQSFRSLNAVGVLTTQLDVKKAHLAVVHVVQDFVVDAPQHTAHH